MINSIMMPIYSKGRNRSFSSNLNTEIDILNVFLHTRYNQNMFIYSSAMKKETSKTIIEIDAYKKEQNPISITIRVCGCTRKKFY